MGSVEERNDGLEKHQGGKVSKMGHVGGQGKGGDVEGNPGWGREQSIGCAVGPGPGAMQGEAEFKF